ncbi:MAG TPA: transcription termination/antitermination NusG family protein [Tepidisphaeraceae bacterium]|nr:transcription termination/antitermination NusG family protein [Tepidisphaeraceae bacterium]
MSDVIYRAPVAINDTFPEDSLDAWFVLRTKSRQEKVLSNELRSRGIANFLPLLSCTKYYGGRKAQVELPVFPGYLFLRGPLEDLYEADRTRRVAQIIKVTDQVRLDRELRNIHMALRGNATLDAYHYLREGVRVEVRDGPFRGLQGVIEHGGRRDRLILQVDILGRAVSLEIEASLLDVIE